MEEYPVPSPPEQVPEPPEPETDADRELLRRRILVIIGVIVTLTVLFAPLWEVDVEKYNVVGHRSTNYQASTLCEVEIMDEGVGGEYEVTFIVEDQTATVNAFIEADEVGLLGANISGVGSYICECDIDAPKGKDRISLARIMYNGLMGG